jgi:hypothetical protein
MFNCAHQLFLRSPLSLNPRHFGVRRVKRAGPVARIRERRNAYKILVVVVKGFGNQLIGRPVGALEENVEKYLKIMQVLGMGGGWN